MGSIGQVVKRAAILETELIGIDNDAVKVLSPCRQGAVSLVDDPFDHFMLESVSAFELLYQFRLFQAGAAANDQFAEVGHLARVDVLLADVSAVAVQWPVLDQSLDLGVGQFFGHELPQWLMEGTKERAQVLYDINYFCQSK